MTIYYAHHIWKYGTKIEDYELSVIHKHFDDGYIHNPAVFVNPNENEEEIMRDCFSKIDDSDALVFSDLSGITGKGVISEIEYAQSLGLPVYRIVANRIVEITEKIRYNLLNTGSNRIYAEITV
jgi:nucleoside 2-deoxyribosyltransferase